MSLRAAAALTCAALLAGCETTDQGRAPANLPPNAPRAVVDDGQAAPYAELLLRARAQALSVTEASYTDNWSAVAEGAGSLEQTAKLLKDAGDVPADRKSVLEATVTSLTQQAQQLRTAAQAPSVDAKKVNDLLATIQYQIRQLKP
jgi:hypothetical protein